MISEDSNRMPLKELCCSLLTTIIGFASCSAISVLIYFTYETIVGKISYCSLWTDIPGRLAIFSTFYYSAGICGILPIPECLRMNCLPQPFILYRLESWKLLFRNLRLLVDCFNCYPRECSTDTETSPLRDGSNERYYDPHPILREQSDRIPIAKSQKFNRRLFQNEKETDVEIANSPKEDSISFGSSTDGIIIPRVKGKCTKPHYLPDFITAESSGESRNETVQNEEKPIAKLQRKTDTASIAPDDVEAPLPNFPRFPWSYLKYRGGLPEKAKTIHMRNIKRESEENEKQNRKGRVKKSVHGWKKDSDEFKPSTSRSFRLPMRRKSGFRGRTNTIEGNIPKIENMDRPTHKRTISMTAPHVNRSESININLEPGVSFGKIDEENKCDSASFREKVDRIKKTWGSGSNIQADSNEVSTSRQDSGVLPSKDNESDENSAQIDTSKKVDQ